MSCCGGNCGCGSGSKGGSSCSGCKMYPNLSYTEQTTTETLVMGVTPVKTQFEGAEIGVRAENDGCKCGANCTCNPCTYFLPRKEPMRQRRTEIAYTSNVAVRENLQRKGIAKKLIAKVESKGRSWQCRAIALHCDLNNSIGTILYRGRGFKCIKVPEGAKWPQPKSSPDISYGVEEEERMRRSLVKEKERE